MSTPAGGGDGPMKLCCVRGVGAYNEVVHSLACHTLYHCEKEGLVTLRTTSCVQRQKSGATNHLRDLEMCGVVSSNATCNEALFYATITSRVSSRVDKRVPKAFI